MHQEYRGFVLDGGHGGFVGGHKRLSPVVKELLVETDVMENVPDMPPRADLVTVLNAVAAAFGDGTDGAGIELYWLIDEAAAAPHQIFANEADRTAWEAAHRNPRLSEFVHLMFADRSSDFPDTHGLSNVPYGGYVLITPAHDTATQPGDPYNFLDGLAHTAGHELAHLLLDTRGANGFDPAEHLADPDASDPADGPNDKRYFMYRFTTPQNRTTVFFSNPTRRQIDLTSKESVERR